MIDFKGSYLKQKKKKKKKKKKDQEYEQILINFIVFYRLKSINLFFKYTFNGLKVIYAFTIENINYNSKYM